MTFNVTLDFKRGPSFRLVKVQAANKEDAIFHAKREAQGFGFDEPVKKATAVPA